VVALRHPRGAAALERALRQGSPRIIARIQDERVFLDPRTVPEPIDDALADAVAAAW